MRSQQRYEFRQHHWSPEVDEAWVNDVNSHWWDESAWWTPSGVAQDCLVQPCSSDNWWSTQWEAGSSQCWARPVHRVKKKASRGQRQLSCHHDDRQLQVEAAERWVDIIRVRFSQEQIHPFFHQRGPIRDCLAEIRNEEVQKDEVASADTLASPNVRLVAPFEPIRCVRSDLHGDLISLDNRRLYALQLAAVERWPARCLACVWVAESPSFDALRPEQHKLSMGGVSPLGQHAGKPQAFMDHMCGDVEVLVASRGSAWEVWNVVAALLERCGVEPPKASSTPCDMPDQQEAPTDTERREPVQTQDVARHLCEQALQNAQKVAQLERNLRAAVAGPESITTHGLANDAVYSALEHLRCAAVEAPGCVVLPVGVPGDRDGYISVSARARALARLQ